ncbi:uncharacterized protein LOC130674552 [Microplitis mediator]|uniref:uncharacterized protein LOC130674552 n=1 Tax=Microplitis mediator TaxID=375433 RepID=UPI0025555BBB|nr:uncharacterized protein LOC130674552 [Microplitis mediator]XP_057335893.1 uncharacterized protein LOC130674552 [Microplitis mediator]XP_057335894.1 uncharacterized protein LOC130674552 [Microplitis mediator]
MEFWAQEWSINKSHQHVYRDLVGYHQTSVDNWTRNFISWEKLVPGCYRDFRTIIAKRRCHTNDVHANASCGILIIDVQDKARTKRVIVFDIPGLDGLESRPKSAQPSVETRWISSITSTFMQYISQQQSSKKPTDKRWLEIDAFLPPKKISLLLACIKRPYKRDNVFSTIDFLHSIQELRNPGYVRGGSRRKISPARQEAQEPARQPDQGVSTPNTLQVPAIAVNDAAPGPSNAGSDDIVAELKLLNLNVASGFNRLDTTVGQLSTTVGQLSTTVGQLSNTVGQLSIQQTQTEAALRQLRTDFEEHCRGQHQAEAVIPPRASPPLHDVRESPAHAAPASDEPEEHNRPSGSARGSSSDRSSTPAEAPSQHDSPVSSSESAPASPQRNIPDSDESSSDDPVPPVSGDSDESAARFRRSMYQLRSRARVPDDIVHKFVRSGREREQPVVPEDSSDEELTDAERKQDMLRRLGLDDPQRARIQVSSTMSFAVDDPGVYANTDFAAYITWIGTSDKHWKCTECGNTYRTWDMPTHVWSTEMERNLVCDVEGCDFVCRGVSKMRKHMKQHH